jgi:hypothetical protein
MKSLLNEKPTSIAPDLVEHVLLGEIFNNRKVLKAYFPTYLPAKQTLIEDYIFVDKVCMFLMLLYVFNRRI